MAIGVYTYKWVTSNLLQMEKDMKSIAVILSGCGVFDGSEIHESVLTMLALSQNKAEVHYFSPNDFQPTVINHITGEEKAEKRNMMEEASRISAALADYAEQMRAGAEAKGRALSEKRAAESSAQ